MTGKTKLLYDVVVILGAAFNCRNGQYDLGSAGKTRARAGAELLKRKACNNLILTGGRTKGINHLSEAEVMLNYLKKKYEKELPFENVFLEKSSKDTTTNVQNALALAKKNKWQKIAFLSSGFHLKRVGMITRAFNSKSQLVSAEEVLGLKSSPSLKARIAEWIFRKLLLIDKKGKTAKLISVVIRR